MSVKAFLKKEATFCIALFAAAVSAFVVPPDGTYAKYIDTRVLFILFSLMLVVAGLRSCGVFDACADFLCGRVRCLRTLCAVLVFLCFFFSMFITNDVSLLTFVPFAILLLKRSGNGSHILLVVVLQTVAANLGSMLTPMGNPQNLFLYTRMGVPAAAFCLILLPYVLISALLLLLCLLAVPRTKLSVPAEKMPVFTASGYSVWNRFRLAVYWTLFILCLLCVLKLIPAWSLAVICGITVFFVQRKLLAKVDYMLLLTFCAFFVFTGNVGTMAGVRSFLEQSVHGHEFAAGLISSQFISNVPSALLLYPFSADLKNLLLGVDIGGLGTLVASLASLISYKLYMNQNEPAVPVTGGKYLAVFTLVNLAFMVVLCLYTVFFG